MKLSKKANSKNSQSDANTPTTTNTNIKLSSNLKDLMVNKMPKIKAKATWVENVRSIVDNQRTHSVVCDLSAPAGGTDSGPTALELFDGSG